MNAPDRIWLVQDDDCGALEPPPWTRRTSAWDEAVKQDGSTEGSVQYVRADAAFQAIDDADKRAVELTALLQDASVAVKVRVMQLAHADTATARHVRDLDTKIDRCLGVGQGALQAREKVWADRFAMQATKIDDLERRLRSATSLAYRAAAELVDNCFPTSDAGARLRSIAEDWKRTE